MFTSLDKALVALIMAVLYILNYAFGIHFGLDETTVTTIVVAVTPVLVWLVPNKGGSQPPSTK